MATQGAEGECRLAEHGDGIQLSVGVQYRNGRTLAYRPRVLTTVRPRLRPSRDMPEEEHPWESKTTRRSCDASTRRSGIKATSRSPMRSLPTITGGMTYGPARRCQVPAGQAQIAEDFRRAFPDLRFDVDLLLGEHDLVVTRWTATGTQFRAVEVDRANGQASHVSRRQHLSLRRRQGRRDLEPPRRPWAHGPGRGTGLRGELRERLTWC